MTTLWGALRRIRGALLARQLFDPHYYAQQQERTQRPKGAEYRDFLKQGWLDGLDPNSWFSCRDYLEANPDVRAAEINPWLHFIRSGRFEHRPLQEAQQPPNPQHGPLTLQATLEQAARGLVDPIYYAATNRDFEDIGLTAADHFMRFGWREGRIPAPWFDVEYLDNHAPLYRLNSGNSLTELLRITTGAPAETSVPESFWVDEDHARELLQKIPHNTSVLVVMHAYYPDDLDAFSPYLRRLPNTCHVVITCPMNTHDVCRRWAARSDLSATIIETVNRGRDWGPFVAVAQELGLPSTRGVLKLHTKRSPHREDGSVWLEHVLEGLVPSEDTADQVTAIFEAGKLDVLAAPGTLSSATDWTPHRSTVKTFYADIAGDTAFEFPAGSMFWMSSRLLKAIGALDISISDYEPELGQLDGTMAHALERAVARLTPASPGLVPH